MIAHLLPTMKVGGAESMAKGLLDDMPGNYKIFQTSSVSEIFDIIVNHKKISLIVCSLWKSVIIGLILKLILRKKFILLLHRSEPAHLIDKVIHEFGMCFADTIIADCNYTLQKRVPKKLLKKTRVGRPDIRLCKHVKKVDKSPEAWTIAYVGRIHKDKNIQRIIECYRQIKIINDKFDLQLYGPLEDQSLLKTVGAYWRGPMTSDELKLVYKEAHFVINLSTQEGFSIAVAEAMCNSVVPITFGAGEMGHYCNDGNSILDRDGNLSKLVAKIVNINPVKYLELSRNARMEIEAYINKNTSLKEVLKIISESN